MPNMFVFYGASGSGQDAVIDGLKEILPIELTITTSTRSMRPGESQGKPYYFIPEKEFREGISENRFIEYAQTYNDDFYGLTKEEFDRVRHSGKTGIWRTDFQGAHTARSLYPKLKIIFIHAPLEILEARIRRRDNPSEEYLQKRLAYIKKWLPKSIYDYKIENEEGKLDEAIKKVADIIRKEKQA